MRVFPVSLGLKMTWEIKKNAAQVLKATGDEMNDSYERLLVGPPIEVEAYRQPIALAPVSFSFQFEAKKFPRNPR
jgi:hypothetical protein